MAATWLLHALYTSLLGSDGIHGNASDVTYLLANTTSGTVRGKVDFKPSVPVAMFKGIPFAKPPVGTLRFKAPEKAGSWHGVRNALAFGGVCWQSNSTFYHGKYNTEDCLYLNVYTPTHVTSSMNVSYPLPVMVWIHGGAYAHGSGSIYRPAALTQRGVVVVTINYRLGVFGFLSTGDAEMPGNFGMLDQVAALKWVKENVAAFGGDPNQVTIFGESAGSSSVSLLTVSPLAKGLFQRAIMESGVSLSPWATQHPGNKVSTKQTSRMIAAGVSCLDLDNTTSLASCLRAVEPSQLLAVAISVVKALGTPTVLLCPRVETDFGFLPDSPHKLIATGQLNHVDTIHGFNTDEVTGLGFRAPTTLSGGDTAIRRGLKQLPRRDQDGIVAYIKSGASGYNVTDMTDVIAFQREVMDTQDALAFLGPMLMEVEAVTSQVADKKHFVYEFNYLSPNSKKPSWVFAGHASELRYVFGLPNTRKVLESDRVVSDQMVEMWTNFAKFGNPTTTVAKGGAVWDEYSLSQPNYLFIKETSEQKVWINSRPKRLFEQLLERLDGAASSA